MGCNCGKKIERNPNAGPGPSLGVSARADPVVAAATGRYEVRTSSGSDSGRTFNTLLAAQQFASRIGGTVLPAP